MSLLPKCFAAYPSNLPGKGDAIEAAVSELNDGQVVEFTSWTSLAISGRPIIGAICEEIDASELLCADITNLNPNVLFELGYALTKRKRLWLIFNPKVAGAKVLFDRFQLLTTIGYNAYSNSKQIVTTFYADQPYQTLDKTLYEDLTKSARVKTKPGSILYIKPEVSTEAVMRITRRVDGAPIPSVIDDPKEIGAQLLEWYVASVLAASGIVCHFLSDDYEDVRLSNAKGAFVAGLAYGLGKPLLMLAHNPYQSPIDYRDLMRTHYDASQAEAFYQGWLGPLIEGEKGKTERKSLHIQAVAAHGNLLDLNIGDPIAEYETDELLDYFIPTAAYAEALKGQHSIFVGRKGSGKTATLLKVADELRSDPRNHICVIKPVDYELEGLLSLLQRHMTTSEKGFLVESFWKALTYTELAKSLYESLSSRPEYIGKSQAEQELVEFILQNEELVLPEFSTRLESLVQRLSTASTSDGNGPDFKTKVSEGAHKLLLNRLRDLLLGAMEKVKNVSILVDNLDKSWTPRTNVQMVSELLFGLLSVSLRIADDSKKSSLGKRRLDVMMTIFIRSDVYAAILSFAREPDKLPIRRIEWNDRELLARVIEKRILNADPNLVDAEEVWSKYFVGAVGGMPTKDFLISSVFPRPRDLIYLVRASLQAAVNRGRSLIEEKDIVTGLENYSSFVLASLMAEGSPQFRPLDDFVTQLFGGPTILTEDDVRDALEESNLGITNASFVIDLLQDLNFLSYETAPNTFVFCYEKDQKPKLTSLAKRTSRAVGARRYQVHPAFHSYLELKPVNAAGQQPLSFA